MKAKTIKKLLLYTFSTLLLLVLVLAVHIYWVYKPKVTDRTEVMARIDLKQQITSTDANRISAWLAHEKGVSHYLVNQQSNIVIFTFFPVKNSGTQIMKDFAALNYSGQRFVATAQNMKGSCPMASSYGYKIYKFIAQII